MGFEVYVVIHGARAQVFSTFVCQCRFSAPPLPAVRRLLAVLVSVLGRPSALETTLKLCRSSLGTLGVDRGRGSLLGAFGAAV